MSRKDDLYAHGGAIGILAGLGCVLIVVWFVVVALIAIPVSLIAGAVWNFVFPVQSVDALVAWAVTYVILLFLSFIGK